ncbi:MAG: Gfo/Idh/MocA family oxidoreductase [Pseudomonadota bacterium]
MPKTMKVGLIGTGMVSGTYVDAVANAGGRIEVVSVAASRLASAQAFVAKHRLSATATDVADMVRNRSLDFVLLTTPPNARMDIVHAFAEMGTPILMEKPVERTLAAARQLVIACEDVHVPLGIMFQHRARPSAQAMRDMLEKREAGPLHAAEISVPWWREQAYYDEPGRGTYARDGGGVLISQAIHTLDLALTFTGQPASVQAMTATTGFHKMEAEDFVSVGVQFENGAVGSVFASTASYPGRAEEIILHYANISVRLQSNILEVVDQKTGKTETTGASTASGAGADPMAFTSDWHRFMIENFADHLDNGTPLFAPGRSALAVHELIAAIELSGREGQRVTVREVT